MWDPHTSSAAKKVEAEQCRAAGTTLNRYRRISSVGEMLMELNWQTLAERHKIPRLVMFYKIHYHLKAITMSLEIELLLVPKRTENALAYVIPASSCDYHQYSFFPRTVREWDYLPQKVVQLGTLEAFRSAIH